jgi:hypothetical protein
MKPRPHEAGFLRGVVNYAPPAVIHNTDVELWSCQAGFGRAVVIGKCQRRISVHARADIVKESEVELGTEITLLCQLRPYLPGVLKASSVISCLNR